MFYSNQILVMTKHIFYSILFLSILLLTFSCGDDDATPKHTAFDYHAHIHSPSTVDKHVGDTIHIHTDFSSMTGETVHHVKVRIYNVADNTEIYNQPNEAHVHESDGMHDFHDDFILSATNGVEAHTDWILEAKVWGHEVEEGEVVETIQFHVHPE